jgi:MFS transporter, FHS family, glucose/mannose:H+ symporter
VSTKSVEVVPKDSSPAQSPFALSGFLVLGVLLGLLGSLLVAWQYHIDVEPRVIGLHFLSLNAGYLAAAALARRIIQNLTARRLAALSCGLAAAALVGLSFLLPPFAPGWRIALLGLMGAAAGGLATALFYLSEPYFAKAPAAAANWGGFLFGCGCLLATAVTGSTYYAGSRQIETGLLALLPLAFCGFYLFGRHPAARKTRHTDIARDTLKDLRSIATVLFSLLLFFQFGNEWALAGWLPLFLIRRLGTNPAWAIGVLALYFLALLCGRLIAQPLLARVSHRRLLLSSIVLALAGYSILSFASTLQVALPAVILIGAGFAPIYPLIAEQLDDRFSYHPGFYSGTVAIAIGGAMGAPWLLGYVDAYLGIQFVMLIPALGSCLVLLLALLIMFEARLMSGRSRGARQGPLIAADKP